MSSESGTSPGDHILEISSEKLSKISYLRTTTLITHYLLINDLTTSRNNFQHDVKMC